MVATERQEMLTGEYWEHLIKKSVSRYFLLDMLSKRPMHGYDIAKSIETCCEGWSKPTDGMIYPTIKELTSGGFLECIDEVHGGRARKVCHLTPKGRQALEAGARAWAGVLPYLAQSVADAGVDVQLGVTGTLSTTPCRDSSVDPRADENRRVQRGEAPLPGVWPTRPKLLRARRMKIQTVAVHAGREPDPETGALTHPIHLSTTFERGADGSYLKGYIYTRSNNPTREALESCLSQLEGAAAAATFSSGSAATAGVFQSLAAGDHVIAPKDVYHGTAGLLRDVFARWSLESTFVDMTDLAEVRDAIQPNTRLIWIETPSNPLLKVTDIGGVSAIAHEAGALCACDNTWATPVLQRPLELGADLTVHATTKYLGGHGDVLGGAVLTRVEDEFFERVRRVQTAYGAVPSPFDCWLVLRGVRTLPLRMRAHSENAARVAAFLSDHPSVDAVHYPGLPDHAGHDLAARQMSGFGGMLSFQLKGGRDSAMRVAANVKVFTRATSLGGTESLIEHRASIEGPDTQTPQNLLRASVGIEDAGDLIDDLAQALAG